MSDEFVRVLTDANFIEVSHEEITKAFAERARVRVKIKAPVEDYRDVRMFRRGSHTETIEIPAWFGLRKRPLEVKVYDDVVLMVATKPDGMSSDETRRALSSARRGGQKVRSGAVLFKYFRHIARADLKALFPNVRVVQKPARPSHAGRAGNSRRRTDPDQAGIDPDGAVSGRRLLSRPFRHDAATTTWSRRWPRSADYWRSAPSCCGNGEISTASR